MVNSASLKRLGVKALGGAIKGALRLLGRRKGAAVAAHLAESLFPVLDVTTPRGPIRFFCPGPMPRWRAESLLIKEPETIEWLDGVADGDVFWDVGANVGVFSLYAALRPGVRVVALEPSAFNYYVLMRNIELNFFSERISAYCVALSNATKREFLYMSTTILGGALSSFSRPLDAPGEQSREKFKHSALGFAMDDFLSCFRLPFPNHLKIDVDGNEIAIIEGAGDTLQDPRLKSILLELDVGEPKESQRVIGSIERAGFQLRERRQAALFKEGPFASQLNHIFVRRG